MKHQHLVIGAALLAVSAFPVLAQDKNNVAQTAAVVASAPGKVALAATVKVTGTIEAIDKATRQVTIKGPKGNLGVVTAGPDVRNFDQVKVGDKVVVRYLEALTLTLKKDGKELRGSTETADAARSAAGDKPAGVVARQVEITADVTAVDAKTQMVTLRGPNQSVDLKVKDPGQFKLIKVGDQVQAVYTEAVALSVEPVANTKK